MTFFQTYANVPARKSAEHRKISAAAKRVPKRIRTMMKPGPVTVYKPAATAEGQR